MTIRPIFITSLVMVLGLGSTQVQAVPLYFGEAFDPTGDTTSPLFSAGAGDLTYAAASVNPALDQLTFSVRYEASSFDSSRSSPFITIDTDENPATGSAGVDTGGTDASLFGTDAQVQFDWTGDPSAPSDARILFWTSAGVLDTTATQDVLNAITVVSDGYDITIPLSVLGDDGLFAFKVVTAANLTDRPGTSGIVDYLTDPGVAPVSTRPVDVPEPGTLALLGAGLAGVGFTRRRRARG